MDTELRRYLNGVVALLSVLVGGLLTQLVLPTTGEAVNTGSVLLWTALFTLAVGGITYLTLLRSRPPALENGHVD